MSHDSDLVERAFALLEDEGADPPSAFVAELRSTFIDEALDRVAPAPVIQPARSKWRPAAVYSWAAAIAVVVFAAIVIFPGESALAIVQDARARFSELPPLRVVVEKVVPGDLLSEEVGSEVSDWRFVTEIEFQDDFRWRRQLVADEGNPFTGISQVGSYQVLAEGIRASYEAATSTFSTDSADGLSAAQSRLEALTEISPSLDQGDPIADEAVRDCRVLGRGRVVEREAHHLVCNADAGEGSVVDGVEAWIDVETGIVLKLVLPNGISFEVLEIAFEVTFEEDAFSVESPDQAGPRGDTLDTGFDIGAEIPSWSLPLADGGDLELRSLRGMLTVIYVWASWCGEVCYGGPDDPLHAIDEAHDSEVNVISMTVSDTLSEVESVVMQRDYSHPIVVSAAQVGRLWGDNGVPSIVVLDEAGRLLGAYVGDLQGDDVRLILAAVASGQPLPDLGGMTLSQIGR